MYFYPKAAKSSVASAERGKDRYSELRAFTKVTAVLAYSNGITARGSKGVQIVGSVRMCIVLPSMAPRPPSEKAVSYGQTAQPALSFDFSRRYEEMMLDESFS